MTLNHAQMQGIDLIYAQMQGAYLFGALLTGRDQALLVSLSTNLSASTNNGGALRFVDFSSAQIDAQTDWRNAFFDTSVIVPDSMRAQIGQPCLLDRFYQNPEPLSDEKFFGQWRGWLTLDPGWDDRSWPILASPEYHKVPLIPPPAGCTWHTDPIATDAN